MEEAPQLLSQEARRAASLEVRGRRSSSLEAAAKLGAGGGGPALEVARRSGSLQQQQADTPKGNAGADAARAELNREGTHTQTQSAPAARLVHPGEPVPGGRVARGVAHE